MKRFLFLIALAMATTGLAADQRVCVYRGVVFGVNQTTDSAVPARFTNRAWIVVDWAESADDTDEGQALSRLTVVIRNSDGTIARTDYTSNSDDDSPAMSVVPMLAKERGLVALQKSPLGWHQVILSGGVVDLSFAGDTWTVPTRLRGRQLTYTDTDTATASNLRYTLTLDRKLTRLTADIEAADNAFQTATAHAENAAIRGN